MAKIGRNDRCKDCRHCKKWSSDHTKATCDLYNEQGFNPDRQVPGKCVDQVTRAY